MKRLIDVLVEEIKVWPDHMTHLWISTGNTIYGKNGAFEFSMDGRWDQPQDYVSATVSRAEWQAAVEALKAEQGSGPVIDWSKQPEGFPLWLEGTTDTNRKHSGWYRKNGEVFAGEDGGQWRASREGQFFTVHRKPVNQSALTEQAAELDWPDGAEFKGEGSDHFYRNVTSKSFEVWIRSRSCWETVPGVPSYQPLIPRPTERAVEWDGVGLPPAGTVCAVLNSALGDPAWERCTILYSGKHRVMYDSESCEERVAFIQDLKFRTQEQIATEERERAVADMAEVIHGQPVAGLKDSALYALYAAGYRKQVAK